MGENQGLLGQPRKGVRDGREWERPALDACRGEILRVYGTFSEGI